jgi:hypothetical protein
VKKTYLRKVGNKNDVGGSLGKVGNKDNVGGSLGKVENEADNKLNEDDKIRQISKQDFLKS